MTESRQERRRLVFRHFYADVNSDHGYRTRSDTPIFHVPRKVRRRIDRVLAKQYLRDARAAA